MKDMTQFILLGLTNDPDLQVPLFITLLLIYTITLGMILLIVLDSCLHTPMYFFFCNLSLGNFCYSSAVIPKVMAGLLIGDKVMTYNACAAQMFFFVAFATVENYILALMVYDRYTAVCKPLHYTATMTTSMCEHLAIGYYVCGFLNSSIHIRDTLSLSFFKSNVFHNFFCDIPESWFSLALTDILVKWFLLMKQALLSFLLSLLF
jgi:olfactory receptor